VQFEWIPYFVYSNREEPASQETLSSKRWCRTAFGTNFESWGVHMLDLAVALAFVGMILLPAMVAMRGTSDDMDDAFSEE
jgi:hypothetical protein